VKMHIIFVIIIIVFLNVDSVEGCYVVGRWGWGRGFILYDTLGGEGDKVKYV